MRDNKAKVKIDVSINYEGTIVLFTPETPAATEFVERNVFLEPWQWLGNGFACEPRLAADIIEGMQAEGLVVQ